MTRKMTEQQFQRACELREGRGLSSNKIVSQLKLDITAGALDWHFLINGVDPPQAKPRRDQFYSLAGREHQRGAFMVRRFTREEDEIVQELSKQGLRIADIARSLRPPRRPNSVRGRLATLAREESRQEAESELV